MCPEADVFSVFLPLKKEKEKILQCNLWCLCYGDVCQNATV